jgi:hypothetical protein
VQTLFVDLDIAAGTSGAATTFTVTGSSPFFYDPSIGNLLMDVVMNNNVPATDTYFDREDGSSIMSRAYTFADGNSYTDSLSLVTRFESVVYVTPEPGTAALVGCCVIAIGFVVRRAKRER